MSANAADIFKLIGFLQDDLRKTQARLVEVRSMLASLNLPERTSAHVCPKCGLDRRTEEMLEAHLRNVHGIGLEEFSRICQPGQRRTPETPRARATAATTRAAA